MSRIYIDRVTGHIKKSDLYLVDVTLRDGSVLKGLEPRRLFPVSNPDMYITLLDEEEKEIAFVRDLKELDEDSSKALTDCFKEYYRIPRILKIYETTQKFGSLTWHVETDKGEVSFRIRSRHSDIRESGKNRIIVKDSNDNRYEIPDHTALDAHSKHILFRYL